MNKTDSKKRNYLRYIAIVLVIVILVSTALLLLEFWEKGHGIFPEQSNDDSNSVITYNNQEYVLRDNLETVLVIGLDKYENSEENTDGNSINTQIKKKKITLGKANATEMLYGKAIHDDITSISSIDENTGRVTFAGRVFAIDEREITSKKTEKQFHLITMDVTDNTDSISVKLFVT